MPVSNNALITILVILIVVPAPVFGGGILHTFSPALKDETFAVARPNILSSKTLVTVSESFIEYSIEQMFFNDNDLPLEAVYLYPLDRASASSKPEVSVDGASANGKVIVADEFFPILKGWIEAIRDPTLLELAGRDIFMISSIHLKPRQQKSFHVHLKIPIAIENEELNLFLPLAGERYSLAPVGILEIMVRSKMARPIRTVFSPTHHITTLREAAHRCMVTVRSRQSPVRTDFRLLFTYSRNDLDFKVFTHRPANQKGFFALFIEPPLTGPETENQQNDVVLVLDRSGSIKPQNLGAAKQAMILGLENLRGGDRFNVITIGSHVEKLANRLVPATSDKIMEAVRFVNAAESEGGTDFYNGVISALEQFTSRKQTGIIILAGDGRATVGLTEPEIILQDITSNNRFKTRIYILALGEEADIALLDKIAISSRGGLSHFSGKNDFSQIAQEFFAKISPPRISELTSEFSNLAVDDILPDRIPDLGREGTVLFGKYANRDDIFSTVRINGKIGGRVRTRTQNCSFPRESDENSYIPRLWAMRRVAALWEKGIPKTREAKTSEQLTTLAKEYGFMLAWAIPPGIVPVAPNLHQENSGELLWRFKTSNVAMDVQSDLVKTVNGKTFRFEKSAWVDTLYLGSMSVRTVSFLSSEYFALVKADPKLGEIFSLGPELTAVRDQTAIKVVSEPKK
jgi:Ca-activated chloride channel homolog